MCVWGKTAFSGIYKLCESFQKQVYGYELSGLHWLQKLGSGKASSGAKVVEQVGVFNTWLARI